MKLLITGATSFIGKKLVYRALERKWLVTAVVRTNKDVTGIFPKSDSLRIIYSDMGEYHNLLREVLQADCAILLAWNGTRRESRNKRELQYDNYKYTLQMIQTIVVSGCGKIILAGSQAEYGPHFGTIKESTECIPNTEYGIFKLKLYREALDICNQGGVRLYEPRFFSLYGVGDYEETLIMYLISKMLKDEVCALTECVQLWDFLYIDDAINGIIKLCESDCSSGVYNFGSGDVRVLKEYVEELKQITGSNSRLLYGEKPYPETGMVSICPDISKMVCLTGWKPHISFREGIEKIMKEGNYYEQF